MLIRKFLDLPKPAKIVLAAVVILTVGYGALYAAVYALHERPPEPDEVTIVADFDFPTGAPGDIAFQAVINNPVAFGKGEKTHKYYAALSEAPSDANTACYLVAVTADGQHSAYLMQVSTGSTPVVSGVSLQGPNGWTQVGSDPATGCAASSSRAPDCQGTHKRNLRHCVPADGAGPVSLRRAPTVKQDAAAACSPRRPGKCASNAQ